MPAETRRVIFTKNELIEAIYDYNQVAQKKLPPGMVVSCVPVSEARVALRLELYDQKNDATEVVEFSPEVTAAALLRYCIRNRIPIPKNATKSIQVLGEDIALAIRMPGKKSQPVLKNADGSAVGKKPPAADAGGPAAAAAEGGKAASTL